VLRKIKIKRNLNLSLTKGLSLGLSKKAQSTVEYILLLCVMVVVSVVIIKGIRDWMEKIGENDIQKAEAQSYRNGKYDAGGFKEMESGGDEVKFHPRANSNNFHIFKRTETEN
jgi:hypothetical protein